MKLRTEVGPIRPPSESHSLLIRFNRNCPWNKCLFCPVYKGQKFSSRSIEELKSEIFFLSSLYKKLQKLLDNHTIYKINLNLNNFFDSNEIYDAQRVLHWLYHGEYTVFIQDADPLLRKKDEIFKLLYLLKSEFPEIRRITAYARAKTINRYDINDLKEFKKMGLLRIHMGLESGSKEVLDFVSKGLEPQDIIKACEKLNQANIETSLYVMPGLGGKELSKKHIKETIDVINYAKPNFLRLRTIGINPLMPLYKLYKEKRYIPPSEKMIVLEIREMIEGIQVHLNFFSDHNLNLLMEINGKLPDNREIMLEKIDKFLSLDDESANLFILARRLNKVFDLNEFFAFSPDKDLLNIYKKIKNLPDEEREELFLELRSQNL